MNVNGIDSISQTETISISEVQILPLNEGFETGVYFTYTGSPQSYIVPSGISSILCTVKGAQGEGMPGCGNGGLGARVISTISVTQGDSLQINVGGQGLSSIGGFNGGGNGASCTQTIGGGGGGASDIRINGNSLSNRVIVAAGGGGAGINCMNNSDHGGGGGATVGLSGYQCNSQTLTVGLGGTQSAGGASLSYFGIQGTSGSLGQGGNGTCSYGGGGGGGFYGGGGGSFGGGGGGSSFAANIAPTNIYTPNMVSGNGQILLDIFPPQHWSIFAPASSGTWQKDTTVGCNPTPDNCVAFYNFWIVPDGDVDELRTPNLDFSNLSSAKLTFDVAYAAYDSTYYDSLEILVSSDCGNNWTSVYNKTGYYVATGNLPTAPAQFWPFEPLSNQWRSDTVDLTPYINNMSVQIAFRNIEGLGNNLYLDNINITGAPPTMPVASFTSDYNSTICEGDSIEFYSNSSGIPIVHNWSFPGGSPSSSSEINPTVSYNTAGNFSAQLIVNNTSGTDTLIMNNLIVNSYPNVTLDLSSVGTPCVNYTFVPLTGGVPLGGIYSGNGVSNGVFNPSIAGLGQHTITYSYTENGCAGHASFDLFVDACSSIDNLSNVEILIYPNPSDGKLIIEGNTFNQFNELYLIDISGRICETWKIDNNKVELDLTKFANGFYNLRFQELQINKPIQILK
jgi:PKD repeat protein